MVKQAAYLGVDLGGTNVRAALFSVEGETIIRAENQHGQDKNPQAIFTNTKNVIDQVLNHPAGRHHQVSTMGIGVPGSVDNRSGIIIKAPNLGWNNIDFRLWLAQEYPFTVYLANDISMAVWGEFCFGAAQGYQDVAFVALGTGVGGGFILNGKPFTCQAESGVEVGHMVMEENGSLCGCGNYGCWETIVSGSHLKKTLLASLAEQPDSLIMKMVNGEHQQIGISTVYAAQKQGDPLAIRVWERFINYLAYGINNIVVIFNPQIFILGGGVSAGLPELVYEVRKRLKTQIKVFNFDEQKVTSSQLGEDAGLIGAAFYGKEKQ